jgi:ubiquinone/menaquinone biosynthesis C-methylase UbiE
MEKEKVNFFRITDRSYDTIIRNLRLSDKDIINLPEESVIVEVGSGTNQSFARAVKELKPKSLVVSIDPTLAINKEDYVTTVTEWKGNIPTAIYYDNLSENNSSEQNYSERIKSIRLSEANKTGNVMAALAPDLPIKENSVNLLIDSWAAGYYLDKESNEFINYLKDISRVLKPGGFARLYPVSERSQNSSRTLHEIRNKLPDIEIDLIIGSLHTGYNIKKL